jgi:hypothetical protein
VSVSGKLASNAWSGGSGGADGVLDELAGLWCAKRKLPRAPRYMFPKDLPDPADWTDPRVGWGVVLPENEAIGEKERASAVDAPEPIRRLLAARRGVVLRYLQDSPNRFTLIRRYYPDGAPQDISLSGSKSGTDRGAIPRYLLIYGTPESVPWELQYQLNSVVAVGRLDLDGQGLENYVRSLLDDWKDSSARVTHAVVWATDHGGDDMSGVMKRTIARRVYEKLAVDADIGPNTRFLGETAGDATSGALIESLTAMTPGLVVTTSHGKTEPLGDPAALKASLGIPIDDNFGALRSEELLGIWAPDGAIWYAHACCSGGAAESSIFDGLLDSDSSIAKVLSGVARLGSLTAPFPRALLGHSRPLRAFVGHVEPTFDWTIQQTQTGEPLTSAIHEALYDRLYQPLPVGLAFEPLFDPIGSLAAQQLSLRKAFDAGEDVDEQLLACQLSARDRMSTVILGDPTATLPVPAH